MIPSEVICPNCGRSLLFGIRADASTVDGSLVASPTVEVVIPATSSSSFDCLDAPDISLGTPSPEVMMGSSSADGVPLAVAPTPPPPQASESEPVASRGPAALDDPLSVLTFDAPALPRLDSSDDAIGAIDEPGGEPPRWPVILLASYASAVTLALLWLILTGRGRGRDVPAPPTIPTDSRPDLARGDDRSKALKVAEERLTSMGRPIRVGSLEITALGLKEGRVILEQVPSSVRRKKRSIRDGGKGALRLRVRLRNLSEDATFAPLDATFVREPDRGLPDSYLETGRGDFIDSYPLAAQSEWSIVGQTFPQLGPGESAETVVVSAPDAMEQVADPMTWRLRVRVGPDRAEVIGLRFARHEIGREGN